MKAKLFILITIMTITLSGCAFQDVNEDDITEAANAILNSGYIKPTLELLYPAPKLILKNENSYIHYGAEGKLTYDSLSSSTLICTLSKAPRDEYIEISSEANLPKLEFDYSPNKVTEKIYKNSELIDTIVIKDGALIMPSHEGLYRIELDCLWENENVKGKIVYSFNCYYNMPSKFTISCNCLEPGDSIIIHAENIKDSNTINLNTTLFDNPVVFYPESNGFFGVIPIDGALEPKDYPIIIECYEDNVKFEDNVTIIERQYPIQHLHVSSSTLALRNQENIKNCSEVLAESRDISNSSNSILWSEEFIEPAKGVITTEYYEIRYTNDNETPRRHTGIDIAASSNTPILATNSGIVVLAEEMTLTGNTLVIDHGCGLFSTYCHLNAMYYVPGQEINQGDILGLMGSTGFSTGSHLHFEMCYNGVYIDPEFFYDKNPYAESLIHD